MGYYWKSISALVAMFFVGLLLLGCGENEKVNAVSLAMLTESPTNYHDTQVVTEGVVRHFDNPLHYWIEDEDLNRVEIFPHERIVPYLGEAVVVKGHFRYSRTKGRRLTLTNVEALR